MEKKMDKVVARCLNDGRRRVIIPCFGALIRRPGGEVVFVDILNADDGVLSAEVERESGLAVDEAHRAVMDYSESLRGELLHRKEVAIEGVGFIRLSNDGNTELVSEADHRAEMENKKASHEKHVASAHETSVHKADRTHKETSGHKTGSIHTETSDHKAGSAHEGTSKAGSAHAATSDRADIAEATPATEHPRHLTAPAPVVAPKHSAPEVVSAPNEGPDDWFEPVEKHNASRTGADINVYDKRSAGHDNTGDKSDKHERNVLLRLLYGEDLVVSKSESSKDKILHDEVSVDSISNSEAKVHESEGSMQSHRPSVHIQPQEPESRFAEKQEPESSHAQKHNPESNPLQKHEHESSYSQKHEPESKSAQKHEPGFRPHIELRRPRKRRKDWVLIVAIIAILAVVGVLIYGQVVRKEIDRGFEYEELVAPPNAIGNEKLKNNYQIA